MRAPFRIGLVGAGKWGVRVLATIQKLEGFQLVAVYSSNQTTPDLCGPDTRVSPRLDEFLAVPMDGLFIASPGSTHLEILKAVLPLGLPCLVEKPLVVSMKQCVELADLSQKYSSDILVDHIQLFHPAFRKLKELASKLGPIQNIESYGGNTGPFRPDCSALWDYGPHDLSMCLDLVGALPTQFDCEKMQDKNFNIRLLFPSGCTASIHLGNRFPTKTRKMLVRFKDETLLYDDLSPDKLSRQSPNHTESVPIENELPLDRALITFRNGVLNRDPAALSYFGITLGIEIAKILHHCEIST